MRRATVYARSETPPPTRYHFVQASVKLPAGMFCRRVEGHEAGSSCTGIRSVVICFEPHSFSGSGPRVIVGSVIIFCQNDP